MEQVRRDIEICSRAALVKMCVICSARAVHQHHWIPQQVLRREGHADKLRDPRNLIWLCFQHHMDHENWGGHGAARITRDRIPGATWRFAAELGEWATVRLERDYPVA